MMESLTIACIVAIITLVEKKTNLLRVHGKERVLEFSKKIKHWIIIVRIS
jgi:hypothetical protein